MLTFLPRIRSVLLGFLPALFLLASSPVAKCENAYWPQFRGPHGNGHAPDARLPETWSEDRNIRWKTAIPGRAWSSPVIWGNEIWLTTATEDGKQMSAMCLDRDSGMIRFNLDLFKNAEPRFCHSMNSYGSPSPVITESHVWCHFGSYGTACIERQSGHVIWNPSGQSIFNSVEVCSCPDIQRVGCDGRRCHAAVIQLIGTDSLEFPSVPKNGRDSFVIKDKNASGRKDGRRRKLASETFLPDSFSR